MAYYVRKIVRAKWKLIDDGAKNVIGNYKADTVANDMRTQANTLSLWRVESLEEKDVIPAVVINSLLGDTISDIDLIFIPEEMMTNFTLKQTDGNTVVINYRDCHRDVVGLTVKSHILFANNVVLKILALENRRKSCDVITEPGPLIRKYRERALLPLINEWIDNNEIEFDQLKEKQRDAILQWRAKNGRAC